MVNGEKEGAGGAVESHERAVTAFLRRESYGTGGSRISGSLFIASHGVVSVNLLKRRPYVARRSS